MSEETLRALARGIGRDKLEAFYSDPENIKEFEAWKAELIEIEE